MISSMDFTEREKDLISLGLLIFASRICDKCFTDEEKDTIGEIPTISELLKQKHKIDTYYIVRKTLDDVDNPPKGGTS